MRWTSLEEWRRRFAVSQYLQLPALLDRAHTLLHGSAHHLQYHEGEQNEADVAYHRLIHPALARLQSRVLLGVAEKRLYLPAAHLALHHPRKVGSRVVGDYVLVVAVMVSGHDQPQGTVFGSVDHYGCGAHREPLAPLEGHSPGQLGDGSPSAAPEYDRPRVQSSHPDKPETSHHFGEPACTDLMGVEDDVFGAQP